MSGKPSLPLRRALLCLILLLSGCAAIAPGTLRDTDHPLAGRLWDTARQAFIDKAELMRRAAQAEVLLLGETHDNPEHHRLQQVILKERLASDARPVLLLEQFDVDQQAALDDARRAGKDLAPLARGWDWPHYRPLVQLADAAGLAVKAANLPRSEARQVVRDGYTMLPANDLQRLALEPVWNAARQRYMADLIEASHCGQVTPPLRDGLVRAQRLRDATLADSALGHMDDGIIFILGRGHARHDVGVPLYLAARRPGTRILSVGFVEVGAGKTVPAQYDADRGNPTEPHDILWFTPRAERPDPCLAFGKPVAATGTPIKAMASP